MTSKDACCFDFNLKCAVDRHYFNDDNVCINGHPGERCSDPPLILPRACHDISEKLRFQCCDGSSIGFQGWSSNWEKCDNLEHKRVDFNYCPGTNHGGGGSSHLNFITICIVVTIVIIVFGLAFVIFKRLRYQSLATASSNAPSATFPRGRGPRGSGTPGGGPTSGARAPPNRPERSFRRAPSVSGDDMAPPSYEEAILLSDLPPAFDKVT